MLTRFREKMDLAVQNRVEKGLGGGCADEQKDVRSQIDPMVLDLKHLTQYTNGDMALERELLGLFKEQAVLQFENINNADDESEWVMAAHTLKGCARGVGACRVGELSGVLEDVGFDGDADVRASILEQLKYAIAVCIVTVETLE